MTESSPHTGAPALDLVEAPPQEWLDEDWHFSMQVPRAYEMAPGSRHPPQPDQLRLLARFERTKPAGKIAVYGTRLQREVDAMDWLEQSPALQSKRIVRIGEVAFLGAQADVELAWHSGQEDQAGRLYATKAGPRLFVLSCSSAKDHQAENAGDFEAAIESFAPSRDPQRRYSEPMARHGGETPVTWQLMLPASWLLERGSANDEADSFQAENLRQPPGAPAEMVGKLAFAVLGRAAGETPREIATLYLDAVAEHGLTLGDEEVKALPATAPFTQSWSLIAQVRREDLPGELRCRVLCHPKVWVLTGVLGLTREDDVDAWMQNKRVLDVMLSTLRL